MASNSAIDLYSFYEDVANNPPSEALAFFANFWLQASAEDQQDARVAAIKIKERLERLGFR